MTTKRLATELRDPDGALAQLPGTTDLAQRKLSRWRSVADLPERLNVLDIGAAQGLFLLACQRLGHDCTGIEPSETAIGTARHISERLGEAVHIVPGRAESLPFPDASFDVVHAHSVIEHVVGLDEAISEVFRVLKPGGLFWFNAASSMSPLQGEIDRFPLFGWYPNSLKLVIMRWVRDHRPALIGGTEWPAINWFTPRKARRLLLSHGFRTVFDRWDLRQAEEGGRAYRAGLRIIKAGSFTKFVADVIVPGCSYAAIR